MHSVSHQRIPHKPTRTSCVHSVSLGQKSAAAAHFNSETFNTPYTAELESVHVLTLPQVRLVLTNHNSVVTLKWSGTFSLFMTFLCPWMGYKGWVTNFEAMDTKTISTFVLLIVLTNHVCCMISNRFHNAIYGHDYECTLTGVNHDSWQF